MYSNTDEIREVIKQGKAVLGIELGSTRIKAVLIGEDHAPIASGSHDWENRYVDHIWTYTLEDIWEGHTGLLSEDGSGRQGTVWRCRCTELAAIGFSAMMHGYMAFDKQGELLVPFRTWSNTHHRGKRPRS